VRTHEKYNEGHIEESINIPLEDIATYKGDIDSVHYIICQQGSRSKEAAEILIKKGYIVVNVLGGMTDWQGEKIED
ncbi:rhodanese-like domain-containing protein, partial [Streptococcus danieliae]|nr:rhodanese-like domain-containing protein [Streptococcus danieliae]